MLEFFTKRFARSARAVLMVCLALGLTSTTSPTLAGPDADRCAAQAANPFEPDYHGAGKLGEVVDVQAAIAACQKAVSAEPDNVAAKAWLARVYYLDKRFAEAVPLVESGARAGNVMAQQLLGSILSEGLGGVPADPARGLALVQQAVDAGYAPALNTLAVYYETAVGVAADPAKAVELYQRAGEMGLGLADANLGYMYSEGNGVPKDPDKAYQLWVRGAERGAPLAMSNLGFAYEEGEGIAQDYTKAMDWYRKADALGEAVAASNIGNLYLKGLGVSKDISEARRWIDKGVAVGESYGQFLLGSMYEEGLGMAADPAQAKHFYELAAAQGDPEAKDALARLDGSAATKPEAPKP